MTHKEYLEMLIGPLAGEGGGGDVPSGSVTLTQNTGPSGVNIADKASAVVQGDEKEIRKTRRLLYAAQRYFQNGLGSLHLYDLRLSCKLRRCKR